MPVISCAADMHDEIAAWRRDRRYYKLLRFSCPPGSGNVRERGDGIVAPALEAKARLAQLSGIRDRRHRGMKQ